MRTKIIACFLACGLAVVGQTNRAEATNIQSYSITESYTGGSVMVDFSLDVDQVGGVYTNTPGKAWFSFTALSVTYTGLDLGIVPILSYSDLYQSNQLSGFAALELYDANNYSLWIEVKRPLGDLTVLNVAAGLQDNGQSSVYTYARQVVPIGGGVITNTTAQPVPEPASMALLGAGLLGLVAARRRQA